MKKNLALAALTVLMGVTFLPHASDARVFVGVGGGYYPYYSPYYYGYPTPYYSYPTYYVQPPVVYTPPNVVYSQPYPQAQQQAPADSGTYLQSPPPAAAPAAAPTPVAPAAALAPAPAAAPVAPVSEVSPTSQSTSNFTDGSGRTCRNFQTSIDNSVINGTACQQADGSWQTVAP